VKRRSGGRRGWRCDMESSWLHNLVNTPPLCCEMFARFFCYEEGLIYAGADGGPAQIISGQAEAWEARARFRDCCQAVGVTEIVLRQGTRPNGDIGKDRFTFHRKDREYFAVNESCKLFRLQCCRGGVGCSADEAGQQSMPSGARPGKSEEFQTEPRTRRPAERGTRKPNPSRECPTSCWR
jgi:hypothetical protein